jgi:hypothetical protein
MSYTFYDKWGVDCCVSCNKPLNGGNHHCSKKHEAGLKAAETRAARGDTFYTPSYGQRLFAGFNMTRNDFIL